MVGGREGGRKGWWEGVCEYMLYICVFVCVTAYCLPHQPPSLQLPVPQRLSCESRPHSWERT